MVRGLSSILEVISSIFSFVVNNFFFLSIIAISFEKFELKLFLGVHETSHLRLALQVVLKLQKLI
jgi:hypothetical protein